MVTLEQVEQLDKKVKKAVSLIEALRLENSRLSAENNRLAGEKLALESKIAETQESNSSLAGAQELLEKGILGAIDQLTSVEETFIDPIIIAPAVESSPKLEEKQSNEPLLSVQLDDSTVEDDQKPLDIF